MIGAIKRCVDNTDRTAQHPALHSVTMRHRDIQYTAARDNRPLYHFLETGPLQVQAAQRYFPLLDQLQEMGHGDSRDERNGRRRQRRRQQQRQRFREHDGDGDRAELDTGWRHRYNVVDVESSSYPPPTIPYQDPRFKLYRGTIHDADTGTTRRAPLFFKVTGILDPNMLVKAMYPPLVADPSAASGPTLLGQTRSKHLAHALHHKLYFPYNSAYVDSLASYLVSSVVEAGICPHFPTLYGVFNGVSRKHMIEFTEEYLDHRHTASFQHGLTTRQWGITAHSREDDETNHEIMGFIPSDAEDFEDVGSPRASCDDASDGDDASNGDDTTGRRASDRGSHSSTTSEGSAASEPADSVDAGVIGAGAAACAADVEPHSSGDNATATAVEPSSTTAIDLGNLEELAGSFRSCASGDGSRAMLDRQYWLEMYNVPVQVVAMEAFEEGMMENHMKADLERLNQAELQVARERSGTWRHCAYHWLTRVRAEQFERKWIAILCQVCMALVCIQHRFGMVHNDLHTQNIMLEKTEHTHVVYRVYSTYYRVPTFGFIIKIIDMGRATFSIEDTLYMGDVFKSQSEAGEQYSYPHSHWRAAKKVLPNPAFDLCRLSCSILDEVYALRARPPVISQKKLYAGQCETRSPLYNLLCEWICDCHRKPINRFQNFDLYKMIARRMHATRPLRQLKRPHFRQYRIPQTAGEAAHHGADLFYHLTRGPSVEESQQQRRHQQALRTQSDFHTLSRGANGAGRIARNTSFAQNRNMTAAYDDDDNMFAASDSEDAMSEMGSECAEHDSAEFSSFMDEARPHTHIQPDQLEDIFDIPQALLEETSIST